MANLQRDPKRKPYQLDDFMPENRKKEETPEERSNRLLAVVENLNAMFGGRDERSNRLSNGQKLLTTAAN